MIVSENIIIPIVQKETILGIDVETTGLDVFNSKLLLLQVCTEDGDAYTIDCRTANRSKMVYIFEMINARNILCVGHNIKFDMRFIHHNYGVMLNNVFDTMLAESIAFAGVGTTFYSLDYLTKKYLNFSMDKSVRKSFIDFTGDFSVEQIEYAEKDVEVLIPLYHKLSPVVKSRGQENTFLNIECKLEPVVAFMENTGIKINVDAWHELAQTAEAEALKLDIQLRDALFAQGEKLVCGVTAYNAAEELGIPVKSYRKAEKERLLAITEYSEILTFIVTTINFSSPLQVKTVLNKLGVSTDSTNAKDLEKFRNASEFVNMILRIREENKKASSFGDEFLKHVNSKTNSVHTTLRQLGAATGRFASADPNMQNIVRDSSYRSTFVAREGYKLCTADYSNIELRIMGEAANEPNFIDAFKHGKDLHKSTASLMFDTPYDDVAKDQRQIAKSLNFAVIYGTTASGLAYNFNIDKKLAQDYLEKYFASYPVLKSFIDRFGKKCLEMGYSVTMGGRRRYLSFPMTAFTYDEINERVKAKRQGVNHMPQGTSADMTKLALINLYFDNPFGLDVLRPILTVHDEIVVEFKEDIEEQAIEFISTCMKRAGEVYLKKIPVQYGMEIGYSWSKG